MGFQSATRLFPSRLGGIRPTPAPPQPASLAEDDTSTNTRIYSSHSDTGTGAGSLTCQLMWLGVATSVEDIVPSD